jgi:hypothetical protein
LTKRRVQWRKRRLVKVQKQISTSNFSFHLNLLNSLEKRFVFLVNVRLSVLSKLVCDWEGLGGRGGEEVHDDSIIKNKEEKLRKT